MVSKIAIVEPEDWQARLEVRSQAARYLERLERRARIIWGRAGYIEFLISELDFALTPEERTIAADNLTEAMKN